MVRQFHYQDQVKCHKAFHQARCYTIKGGKRKETRKKVPKLDTPIKKFAVQNEV